MVKDNNYSLEQIKKNLLLFEKKIKEKQIAGGFWIIADRADFKPLRKIIKNKINLKTNSKKTSKTNSKKTSKTKSKKVSKKQSKTQSKKGSKKLSKKTSQKNNYDYSNNSFNKRIKR